MQKLSLFNQTWLPYLLLAPQLVIAFLFFIYPAAQTIGLAFQPEKAQRWFNLSLENFNLLFSQSKFLEQLFTAATVSFLIAILSLALAFLLVILATHKIRYAHIYQMCIAWPCVVSPAVAAIIGLFFMTSGHFSGLNTIVSYLSEQQVLYWLVAITLWKQVPYSFLFLLIARLAINPRLFELAALEGANRWQQFCTIIFPKLASPLFLLFMINLIYGFFDTFTMIDFVVNQRLGHTPLLMGLFGQLQQNSNAHLLAAHFVMNLLIIGGLSAWALFKLPGYLRSCSYLPHSYA